jgi:hypothetical protein
MSAGLTHPVIALLDHPLFAFGGKRARNKIQKNNIKISKK